ncbi:MAG: response regulator transcription factor [Nitrospira sp.]
MNEGKPTIFVIDDDLSIREALARLIGSVGWQVQTFQSAQEFLQAWECDAPGCLILDVRLTGLSGLDLQRSLADRKSLLPIIFLTGHGNIPMSVRAMKAGAVEFLTKPCQEQDLLDAIQQAVDRDRAARDHGKELAALRVRYDLLTPREREVMELVVSGLLNKQIAATLKVSEVTIKVHRGQIMKKMQATSLANLVTLADKLKQSVLKS